MNANFFIVICGAMAVIFLMLTVSVIWIIKRQRQQRRMEPPEEFTLLRRPGESLTKQANDQINQVLMRLLYGSWAIVATVVLVPGVVLWLEPGASRETLVWATLALAAALFGWLVRRALVRMKDCSSKRLGGRGERLVGEQMTGLLHNGFWLYHDVPVEIEGRAQNIDHVAVGPLGVVIIETKTRSRPKKGTGMKAVVRFDGERLIWPNFGDDKASVRQVRRCAAWMEAFVLDKCGRKVEVEQMIAIPGWMVEPGKHYRPRVVSGLAVANALMAMLDGKPQVLSEGEVKKVVRALESLCRDVED